MTAPEPAVAAMAVAALGANRLVVRPDAANGRRRRVAERCGVALEGRGGGPAETPPATRPTSASTLGSVDRSEIRFPLPPRPAYAVATF